MESNSLVNNILSYSKKIKNNRNNLSVMCKVNEEIGELSTEIAIDNNMSYKEAGKDGVIGEAIDAIISIVDIIYLQNPDITEDEINEIASKKLSKWESKERERLYKSLGQQDYEDSEYDETIDDEYEYYIIYPRGDKSRVTVLQYYPPAGDLTDWSIIGIKFDGIVEAIHEANMLALSAGLCYEEYESRY